MLHDIVGVTVSSMVHRQFAKFDASQSKLERRASIDLLTHASLGQIGEAESPLILERRGHPKYAIAKGRQKR